MELDCLQITALGTPRRQKEPAVWGNFLGPKVFFGVFRKQPAKAGGSGWFFT
jgi:hypothetical protein